MFSKITIQFDFEKKEPYLEVFQNSDSGDVRDRMAKAFLEQANEKGIELVYKNDIPQIRVKP